MAEQKMPIEIEPGLIAEVVISDKGEKKVYQGSYQIPEQEQTVKQNVALKFFSGSSLRHEFQSEVAILSKCQSPYIVQYLKNCTDRPHPTQCWIIMEYCSSGSLFNILHNRKVFIPWCFNRWEIAIDISKGLVYLHAHHIVQGDLKSSDILFTENHKTKISDFGSARSSNQDIEKKPFSLRWGAPELFSPFSITNTRTDVYSFGVILFEIASSTVPFLNISDEELKKGSHSIRSENFPEDCPHSYKQWAMKCLSVEAQKRPSAREVSEGLIKEQDLYISTYYDSHAVKPGLFFDSSNSSNALFQEGRAFRLNQQYTKAIKCLNEAVNKGCFSAYLDLYLIKRNYHKFLFPHDGREMLSEEEYKNKIALNVENFEKALQTDTGEAFYNVAKFYELDLDMFPKTDRRDPEKALYHHEVAANKNYPLAKYDLGELYLMSDGYCANHKQDLKLAEKYFSEAANEGLAIAQFRLGECYEQGLFGMDKVTKAMEYYERAAKNGHITAILKMGASYEKQYKLNPSKELLEKALTMYKKAAEEGFKEAIKKVMCLSEVGQQAGKNLTFFDGNSKTPQELSVENSEAINLAALTI